MKREFDGFKPEAYMFLTELAFNNNRMWMEENRQRYREFVQQPMQQLAEILLPTALEIDPEFNPRMSSIVSRINRDTRYSKNKLPYRDHMWMSYKPVGKSNSEAFTYYVWLTPDEWGYGAGFYAYVPELMAEFRARLEKEGEEFLSRLQHPGMERFGIYGDSLRRPIKNDLPKDIAPWYNKKNFGFECVRPIGPEVFTSDMAEEIREGFRALHPVYSFVTGLTQHFE